MKATNTNVVPRLTFFLAVLFLIAVLSAGSSVSRAHQEGCPANSKPVQRTEANGEIIVSCQCIAGYTKYQGRCELIEKVNALKNAKAIKDAVSQGQKPPFEPLWNYYQTNRDIAEGFAPAENRCAIVLSLTLGIEPRANEASLRDLKLLHKINRERGVIPEVADAELAKRYYIRAQELANRLRDEWGEPVIIKTRDARKIISGKRGIVLIQDAYGEPDDQGHRTIDHIDVWNGSRIGSEDTVSSNFEQAPQVWFWQIP